MSRMPFDDKYSNVNRAYICRVLRIGRVNETKQRRNQSATRTSFIKKSEKQFTCLVSFTLRVKSKHGAIIGPNKHT